MWRLRTTFCSPKWPGPTLVIETVAHLSSIERYFGPTAAILISSLFFTLIHLTKSWALIGMVPIIFGAGLLLGWLARASASLVFNMIGHAVMDVGLFAYWWTQIAGTFPQRPISQTGVNLAFLLECAAFVLFFSLTVLSIRRLSAIRGKAKS